MGVFIGKGWLIEISVAVSHRQDEGTADTSFIERLLSVGIRRC
jgi:hypothetical protein